MVRTKRIWHTLEENSVHKYKSMIDCFGEEDVS